jgi:hypothetical protein
MALGIFTNFAGLPVSAVISTYQQVASEKPVRSGLEDQLQRTGEKGEDRLTLSREARRAQTDWDIRRELDKDRQDPQADLNPQEKQIVEKYKDADREVRAHEQAHLAAAGGLAISGANFQQVTGPDGLRSAIAGEVQIDTSPIPNDPQAAMAKAQNIQRTALAPAQPSPQDRRVASEAVSMASRAAQELMRMRLNDFARATSPSSRDVYPRFSEPQEPMWVDIRG